MRRKLVFSLLLAISFSAFAYSHFIPPNMYKNPAQEFHFVYQKAHKDQLTWAIYKLANFYQEGYGTKPDKIKAYVWYKMATLQKFNDSADKLAALKKTMTQTQITKAEKAFIVTRDMEIKSAMSEFSNLYK